MTVDAGFSPMTRFAAGIVGLLTLAATTRANYPDPSALAVPPEQVTRARELVRQLGSDAYRDRDKAARELRRMGRFAVSALSAAAAEVDPEVRARCEELLPAAEADDMAARVAAFLADTDGRFAHDLPGWAEFKAAVGDDPPARELFAALAKNPDNHPLLRATGRPADRLPAALVARRQQLQYRLAAESVRKTVLLNPALQPTAPADPADVAALLLAESLVSDRPVHQFQFGSGQYYVTAFLHSAKAKDVVASDSAFRRLAIHWLETRNGPTGPTAAMNVARQIGFGPDVVNGLAAKSLSADGVPPQQKGMALNILLRGDGKDHLSAITRLFADNTVLIKGVPNTPSPDDLRLRDAALATAVRLTGQDPADYGLTTGSGPVPARKVLVLQAGRVIPNADNLYTMRFSPTDTMTADQKRDAAFKKWDEWAAKNRKDGKPNP